MCGLPRSSDPNVLVGFETNDDCGVYRLGPDLAIVQSVDVLTPVVDDPWVFGQIAAANALSDLYAMGAEPRTALNILALPPDLPDKQIARDILRGGFEKLTEGGAAVIGGHTIQDPELKYGVCVTGVIRPDRILRNANARPGDVLVLTKAIGTGVVATAIKGGLASEQHAAGAAASMARLNAMAARAALDLGAQACTDVTGFGLLGHLLEMVEASGVGAVIESARVPLLPGALDYCGMGMVPAATGRNKEFFSPRVEVRGSVSDVLLDLLYDPQTSGGLLVPLVAGAALAERLHAAGLVEAAVIGRIVPEPKGRVVVV
jgi:selenide,water dikinase